MDDRSPNPENSASYSVCRAHPVALAGQIFLAACVLALGPALAARAALVDAALAVLLGVLGLAAFAFWMVKVVSTLPLRATIFRERIELRTPFGRIEIPRSALVNATERRRRGRIEWILLHWNRTPPGDLCVTGFPLNYYRDLPKLRRDLESFGWWVETAPVSSPAVHYLHPFLLTLLALLVPLAVVAVTVAAVGIATQNLFAIVIVGVLGVLPGAMLCRGLTKHWPFKVTIATDSLTVRTPLRRTDIPRDALISTSEERRGEQLRGVTIVYRDPALPGERTLRLSPKAYVNLAAIRRDLESLGWWTTSTADR